MSVMERLGNCAPNYLKELYMRTTPKFFSQPQTHSPDNPLDISPECLTAAHQTQSFKLLWLKILEVFLSFSPTPHPSANPFSNVLKTDPAGALPTGALLPPGSPPLLPPTAALISLWLSHPLPSVLNPIPRVIFKKMIIYLFIPEREKH